jgi:hypothetical protein
MLHNASKRAKKFGREFTLDRAFIVERLEKGVCEVSGLPFVFQAYSLFAPSLDRKDNSKGYTPDNTQVVVFGYNTCKSAGTHEDVLKLCEALCTRAKR